MYNILIPVNKSNGFVVDSLENSKYLLILDLDTKRKVLIENNFRTHKVDFEEFIESHDLRVIICTGMSGPLKNIAEDMGVKIMYTKPVALDEILNMIL